MIFAWRNITDQRTNLRMSGPISTLDAPPTSAAANPDNEPCVQILVDREAMVGALRVRRALPRLGRRMVGAWCFADHLGPADVTETVSADIGPHPHIGLHTVTWLVEGELLHRDSLGSEQVIRPGQLNLMSAGNGVVHSEEATGAYRGPLHGLQLWVAQPDTTRHGAAAFEHHAELPRVALRHGTATVLIGELEDVRSPARADTPLLGAHLDLRVGSIEVGMRADFEYALIVLDGALQVDSTRVEPGQLAYLGCEREALEVTALEPTRGVLLGGEPFPEPILMWWNFVARSREEIDEAYAEWQSGAERFGPVESPLPRIPAPPLVWTARG
jgi:redox-sensitive bicupin YhaK (pirin superfamily)